MKTVAEFATKSEQVRQSPWPQTGGERGDDALDVLRDAGIVDESWERFFDVAKVLHPRGANHAQRAQPYTTVQ